jgi:Tol biopolymer transport system component
MGGIIMRRRLVVLVATAMTLFGLVGVTGPAEAKAPGPNGQIAFARQANPVLEQGHIVYTVNPDGSHLQELAEPADIPRWSPDGTEVSIDDADCMFDGTCAAVIFNADTGSSRVLPAPVSPLFNQFFGCDTWSHDGARLACGGFTDSPGVSGVYTIRSSDGGGLTKVLSCDEVQPGAACGPGDYSPDGKRLVVGVEGVGLFVVRLNGSGLRQITPTGMLVDEGSNGRWSSSGDHIMFVANPAPGYRRAIFVVNADGTGLHQVPIPGCGGAVSDPMSISCFGPDWSPDGTKIVLVRASARFNVQNVYTVNADGSGLFQVTYESGGLEVTSADWGTHPLAR